MNSLGSPRRNRFPGASWESARDAKPMDSNLGASDRSGSRYVLYKTEFFHQQNQQVAIHKPDGEMTSSIMRNFAAAQHDGFLHAATPFSSIEIRRVACRTRYNATFWRC
ncbi:hypothetical protein [Roseateles chitosanitabidus]|uniref:hypothetical protein n=1 Tax=Roseateles chitosanitabidus TaxID=65048 RepID=UPI0011DF500C|nr:hypothetical protein [Roseateles chitosanitabidus]